MAPARVVESLRPRLTPGQQPGALLVGLRPSAGAQPLVLDAVWPGAAPSEQLQAGAWAAEKWGAARMMAISGGEMRRDEARSMAPLPPVTRAELCGLLPEGLEYVGVAAASRSDAQQLAARMDVAELLRVGGGGGGSGAGKQAAALLCWPSADGGAVEFGSMLGDAPVEVQWEAGSAADALRAAGYAAIRWHQCF
jgi:hypothetical protein